MENQPIATLTFQRRQPLSDHIEGVWFTPDPKFLYIAGQYLHMVMPHKDADNRGIKRYFTIASAPAEDTVMIASKFTPHRSTFKEHLHSLKPGDQVTIDDVGGDFILPARSSAPLLFIAGGIGITPFRSMTKQMLLTNTLRPMTLLYAAKQPDEFVFDDVFSEAERQGAKIIRMISDTALGWNGEVGRIDPGTLARLIPNLAQYEIYLSGPEPMVEAVQQLMQDLGVPIEQLHRDFFEGYSETYQKP